MSLAYRNWDDIAEQSCIMSIKFLAGYHLRQVGISTCWCNILIY
jgi:hypothetical protein